MSKYVVRKSIRIKAELARVWDALTNPEKTKEYFFHCKVFSAWKAGASIIFKGKLLYILPIELRGKILEIEPGRLLKYNLRNGREHGGYSVVTDVLTYENGATLLSVTDDVGNGRGAEKRMRKSEKGWDKVLNGLKRLVEKE